MVWMNNQQADASAKLDAVKTIHAWDPAIVLKTMRKFLDDNLLPDELPDLLLTGENGDETLDPFYDIVESNFAASVPVARYKHFCGEYCTASSFACWLSIQILQNGIIPTMLIKKE